MTLKKLFASDTHRINGALGLLSVAAASTLVPTSPVSAQCEADKFSAHDTTTDDLFGRAVALDGCVLVVGALGHAGGIDHGAGYVLEFDGTQWVEVADLIATDSDTDDEFGGAVAIWGDTIVVGAAQNDDAGSNSGSAYVFVKPASGWDPDPGDGQPAVLNETAKLTASDAAAGDRFGFSVAVFCDTIAVGAINDESNRGAVYIFEKPPAGWTTATETVKLTASDGAAGDRFSAALAIDCNTMVVGADQVDTGPGAAYVFERQDCVWTETAKLTASDGEWPDRFGRGVDVRGRLILVGAFLDDVGADADRGSAYLFERPVDGWADMTETAKLTAWNGTDYDNLGLSVSILCDDTVFVGTHAQRFNATTPGYVCMYERPPGGCGGWVSMTETELLDPNDGEVGDQFGTGIDTSGDTLVVGAPLDDDNGNGSGSAYIYIGIAGIDYNGNGKPDSCEAFCPADANGDNEVDIQDFLLLLRAWGSCTK